MLSRYNRLYGLITVGIVIIATTGLAVNTLEIITEQRDIKMLPTDYNPYQALYDEMLYPTVRIESPGGIGSGVIANLECIDHVNAAATRSLHSIFILTASHVVGNNTSVTVTVYSYISNTQTVLCELRAFVVITDTNKDLALLATEIHGITRTYSAKLAKKNYVPYLFMPIYTVGCSLGLNPRPSQGILTSIGGNPCSSVANYWEVSSSILPGNSGGPVFSADTPSYAGASAGRHEVIGIAVWVKVYHGQLVTTMAGIVPVTEIYKFLDAYFSCHPEQSEGSLRRNEILRYAQNDLGVNDYQFIRYSDVSSSIARLEGAMPADRADDAVKRARQPFAKQQLVLRKDITMPTLFEVKLEIPAMVAAASDVAEKWLQGLLNNAELVENRIKAAIPDEASFQSKLATPAAQEWNGFVNPAYRTKHGRTKEQLVNTFAKNIGNAFGRWYERLTKAFATEDGVKAKRYKDAVTASLPYMMEQLRMKVLRMTGDRAHGIGAGAIAVYWLTGEATVAGKLRQGDQLIDGGPTRICPADMVQAFRAALMNRFVQAAMLISNSNYDTAVITAQNDSNNHLVQSFVDPGVGLMPFATGAPSNVDFIVEDGIFKLRLKATQI
jgi:hypothetical protein